MSLSNSFEYQDKNYMDPNDIDVDFADRSLTFKKQKPWKKCLIWCPISFAIFLVVFYICVVCYNVWFSKPEVIGLVDGKLHLCPSTPNCVSSYDAKNDS